MSLQGAIPLCVCGLVPSSLLEELGEKIDYINTTLSLVKARDTIPPPTPSSSNENEGHNSLVQCDEENPFASYIIIKFKIFMKSIQ